MKQELEEKLFKRFPWTEAKDWDWEEVKGRGYFVYCQVDDGWFNLLWQLFEEIENHYKATNQEHRLQDLIIDELKEKYGCLRVYVTNDIYGVDHILDKYEDLSKEVCERCGAKGSMRKRLGVAVRCEVCFNNNK
jgi:ribosomal protein L40E